MVFAARGETAIPCNDFAGGDVSRVSIVIKAGLGPDASSMH